MDQIINFRDIRKETSAKSIIDNLFKKINHIIYGNIPDKSQKVK